MHSNSLRVIIVKPNGWIVRLLYLLFFILIFYVAFQFDNFNAVWLIPYILVVYIAYFIFERGKVLIGSKKFLSISASGIKVRDCRNEYLNLAWPDVGAVHLQAFKHRFYVIISMVDGSESKLEVCESWVFSEFNLKNSLKVNFKKFLNLFGNNGELMKRIEPTNIAELEKLYSMESYKMA